MKAAKPFRILLAVIVGLQVLAAGAFAVGAMTGPSDFKATSPPREPSALPLTIETGYQQALQIATNWSATAQLFAVNMQIDWPLTVDPNAPIALAPGGWMSFTFYRSEGNGNPEETLSLFFERTSGVLVQQEEIEWPNEQEVTPLDPRDLAISSSAAIMAVEAREGRSWRSACPVNRHLTRISLTANVDAAIAWIVTYADAVTDRAGLVAHLDAERGEITRLDVLSMSCEPQ